MNSTLISELDMNQNAVVESDTWFVALTIISTLATGLGFLFTQLI